MTWMTTWPADGVPQYAEHKTESRAAAHAERLIRNGTTPVATYFELETQP